jgi:hypothetical protein
MGVARLLLSRRWRQSFARSSKWSAATTRVLIRQFNRMTAVLRWSASRFWGEGSARISSGKADKSTIAGSRQIAFGVGRAECFGHSAPFAGRRGDNAEAKTDTNTETNTLFLSVVRRKVDAHRLRKSVANQWQNCQPCPHLNTMQNHRRMAV